MTKAQTARTLRAIRGSGLPRSCDEQVPIESVVQLGRSIYYPPFHQEEDDWSTPSGLNAGNHPGQWECTVIVSIRRWWGITQEFEVFVSRADFVAVEERFCAPSIYDL